MSHPVPTALRLVKQGGKLRAKHAIKAAREPCPALGLPVAPAYFNAEQKRIRARLVKDSPDGLLTRVDGDLVDGYVMLVQARNQAARMFNESGAAVLCPSAANGTLVVNPYLKEYRRLTELLRVLQADLGYSPAARTRITVAPLGEEEVDPLTRFLGGK